MTRVVEVFADVVCPFTHVGLQRLIAYRNENGLRDVTFRVRSWPLEIVNGERLSRDLLVEEIEELRASAAPDLFAGFTPSVFPLTSLPALTLARRAYRASDGLGEAVSVALREALFEHGRDISDPAELVAIAGSLNVDRPDDRDGNAVLADLSEGRSRGVIGSPHFFVGGTGYFCPSLAIERLDGRLEVAFDADGFASFVQRCFAPEAR
jgi:predicted DsbA family dithiol-disulfide isomerase